MQNRRIVLFPVSSSSQDKPAFCVQVIEVLCGGELKQQYELGPYETEEACLEDLPRKVEGLPQLEIIIAFIETIPFPLSVLRLRRKIEAVIPNLLPTATWIIFARERESGLDVALSRLGDYWPDPPNTKRIVRIWRAEKPTEEASKSVMNFLIVQEQIPRFVEKEELLERFARLHDRLNPPRMPSPMKRSGSSTTARIIRSESAMPQVANGSDDSHDPPSK